MAKVSIIALLIRSKASSYISFFCAMVAAMTLKLMDPFGSGKLVLFQVTYDKAGPFSVI